MLNFFSLNRRKGKLRKKRNEITSIPSTTKGSQRAHSCFSIIKLATSSLNCNWAKLQPWICVVYISQSHCTAPLNFISDFSLWINPELINLGKRQYFLSQRASCMEHFNIWRGFNYIFKTFVMQNSLKLPSKQESRLVSINLGQLKNSTSFMHTLILTHLPSSPPLTTSFQGWGLIWRNTHKSTSHLGNVSSFHRIW